MTKWLSILFISINCNAQTFVLGTIRNGNEWAGKTAVFMGNSITNGIAASDNAHRWTSLFCAAKGATEDNRGVNGCFMQQNSSCGGAAFPFDQTTIPAYNISTHSYLFIDIGINDVGLNTASFTSAGYKSAYQTVLTYAMGTRGWPPERIILLNVYHPFSWDVYTFISGCSVSVAATDARGIDYNTKVPELSSENGCLLIDIWTPMQALSAIYYAADELHPNDAGHAFIANYLISVLDLKWFVILILIPTFIKNRGRIIPINKYNQKAA